MTWNKRWTVWAALAMGVALLGGCPTGNDDDDDSGVIKAAWMYVSAIGDGGWSYSHNQGRLAAETALDFVETSYAENVPEDEATATAKIRELAADNDIVFTTSFGYMDPTLTVAGEEADTFFEHCSGYKDADNVGNYFGRIYQARYLSGMVAGAMSVTGDIGYVAAFPIPEVIRGINAFTLGAQSVASGATVHVEWTSTWFDPTVEGDAADTLITAGVDVMAQHQDSTAPIIAARDASIYAIGYHSDMAPYAPDTVLTSAIWNWGPYYTCRIQAVKDGSWTKDAYWGGLDDDIIELTAIHSDVPQATRTAVATAKGELAAGDWDVFDGPFNKQDGSSWIASGATLGDGDMLGMMEFVEGVVGSVD